MGTLSFEYVLMVDNCSSSHIGMNERQRAIAFLGSIWVCTALSIRLVQGADIISVQLNNTDRTYFIAFEAIVAIEAADAQAILTNYANWPKLSKNIIESRLIEILPNGFERIHVLLRSCLFGNLFCKVLTQIKDLDRISVDDTYSTTLVPNQNDFVAGFERWTIKSVGRVRTSIRYNAVITVAFYVPPLIGRWVIQRELKRQLIGTTERLEYLAARQ